MSDTMKAALDAALQFHTAEESLNRDLVIETAKIFHRELATAAPGAAEDWDEEWYSRVNSWIRALSADQRGSVESALRNSAPAPVMPFAYAPTQYTPVPQAPPQVPEAWALLDKLNGPQPYPGTAVPAPFVTIDELNRRLAELGGDPRSAGDVAKAAATAGRMTMNEIPLTQTEPAAISEALGRRDEETLLAASERVMSELAEWRLRAEQAEAAIRKAKA